MITKELALTLKPGQELWHNAATNADGTPVRARVNGKCKTWKRYPERFQLPMKHGLKQCFYICHVEEGNHAAAGWVWSLPERWPIERHWRQS